jgi:hypothetical protein
VINNPGTTMTLTFYDALSATGTPIASVAVPAAFIGMLAFGTPFTTGLTVVTGGTPGDAVVYFL